jgi:hypothetical protein
MIKSITARFLNLPIVYGFYLKYLAKQHRVLHNQNELFYTLSPTLMVAIVKAFQVQKPELLKKHGYYEFGLFKGFNFWFAEQISRSCTDKEFKLYGFDSFEGLPQSKVDIDPVYWAQGNYASSLEFVQESLKKQGADFSRLQLFRGFFSKSLFAEFRKKTEFFPVSICVIDSDMYESCSEVLSFIGDLLIPGSLLIFDDFNAFNKDNDHGERRALKEFEEKHPAFTKELLFEYGWHGVAFKVLTV